MGSPFQNQQSPFGQPQGQPQGSPFGQPQPGAQPQQQPFGQPAQQQAPQGFPPPVNQPQTTAPGGDPFGARQVDVQQRDPGAQAGQLAGGGFAQARACAGDQCCVSLNIHGDALFC